MTFSMSATELSAALDRTSRVVEKRNTIPILAHVLLAWGDGKLDITATDLDMEARTSVVAETPASGTATVDAARFAAMVGKLPPKAQLRVEPRDGQIVLTSGRSRATFQTLPAEDFPSFAAGEMTHEFEIQAGPFALMLDAVDFAISSEETRYYLNGVYFHVIQDSDGPLLRAVSTDGYKLARYENLAPEGSIGMPGVIVPTKAITELRRLTKGAGRVSLAVSTSKLRATFDTDAGTTTLASKLIDGTFPDYTRVIPTGNDKRASLKGGDLASAIERVTTISSERARVVRFDFEDNQLTLSVTNPDAGEAREVLEADYQGPGLTIGFNGGYIREILAALVAQTCTVEFEMFDAGSPTIIRTMQHSALLCICMPMRV